MKEITGNIFTVDADAICVTTNGVLRKDGSLVMGAGIAKQFAERYPELPSILGEEVKYGGNHCYSFKTKLWTIVSYPTKEHWKDPSNLTLIRNSALELLGKTVVHKWKKIVLPRPGCGLGGLRWEQVKAVLEPILDDRFYIITPK